MSDIVERLRHCAENASDEYLRELAGRSADQITRLRAEVERLRAALEPFACDRTVEERCAIPDNCRNFVVRRTLATQQKETGNG